MSQHGVPAIPARLAASLLLSDLAKYDPTVRVHLFSNRFRRPRVDRFLEGLATSDMVLSHAIPTGDAELARDLARIAASEVLRAFGFPPGFLHRNHSVPVA